MTGSCTPGPRIASRWEITAVSGTDWATKCGTIEPMAAKASQRREREQGVILMAGSTAHQLGYGVAEAAELLGVSPGTVRRWAGPGKLAAQRDSGGAGPSRARRWRS